MMIGRWGVEKGTEGLEEMRGERCWSRKRETASVQGNIQHVSVD